jgi:transketolase
MLTERSKQLRRDTIKLSKANGGYHWGGSFSCIEILIALYDHVLAENDKFILSKGHSCWPWYVILREKGFNPKLEGHPSRDPYNGIHCTTGSLGHGFPTAVGMAMAKRFKKEPGNIYVLMGDGECQEGTTWESMLIAAHYKLDNLIVIVDTNGIQGSGIIFNTLPINEFHNIAKIIGLEIEQIDGHNLELIVDYFKYYKETTHYKPYLLIANTTKGKGVSFMEDKPEWHAKWLDDKHEQLAMMELDNV